MTAKFTVAIIIYLLISSWTKRKSVYILWWVWSAYRLVQHLPDLVYIIQFL